MVDKTQVFEVDGIETEVARPSSQRPVGTPTTYHNHIRPIFQLLPDYLEHPFDSEGISWDDGRYRYIPGEPICEQTWIDRQGVIPSDICRCHNPVYGPQQHPNQYTSLELAWETVAHQA